MLLTEHGRNPHTKRDIQPVRAQGALITAWVCLWHVSSQALSAGGSTWSFSSLRPLRVLFKNWTKILLALVDHPARSWLGSLGFDISTEMDLQPPTLLSSALTSSCCAPWNPRITGLMELVPSLGLHTLSLGVLASLFSGKNFCRTFSGKKTQTSVGFLQFSRLKATVKNQL